MSIKWAIAMIATLPSAAAADFALSDMLGSWGGSGTYFERPTKAKMRCRMTVGGTDASVAVTGRCASRLGAQDINIVLTDVGGGRVSLRPGPGAKVDGSGISGFDGSKAGALMILTGASEDQRAKIQFEKLEDGKMVFASEREWDGKSAQSVVTLKRK